MFGELDFGVGESLQEVSLAKLFIPALNDEKSAEPVGRVSEMVVAPLFKRRLDVPDPQGR